MSEETTVTNSNAEPVESSSQPAHETPAAPEPGNGSSPDPVASKETPDTEILPAVVELPEAASELPEIKIKFPDSVEVSAKQPVENPPAPAAEPPSEPAVEPEPPQESLRDEIVSAVLDQTSFKYIAGPLDKGVPYQVPDLPPHFVARAELLAIKRLLISLTHSPAALAPLTLHGPPGAGKTSLAAAIAHDGEVIKAFPDGILMISLGDDGDPQHAQATWGKAMGVDLSHLPDSASRAAALRNILHEKQCLLIIDDVTDVEQIKSLNVGGPSCVRIITTDKPDEITYALKTRRYAVGKMSDSEALNLIVEWAGILPDIYLPTVKEIIKRLGNSALALALVGAQARQGITWLRLLEVLRDDQGPISTLDADDAEVKRNALGLVINLVLSRLGGAQHQRSALLGTFAAGTGSPFSVDAAAACWQMTNAEARQSLDVMVESALLQHLPGDLYALHRSLRDHLRRAANPNHLVEAAARVRDYYLNLVEGGGDTAQIDAQLGQIMGVFKQTSDTTPELSNHFADALLGFFEARGLWANLVTLAEAVVEATDKTNDLPRKHAYLNDLGYAYTILGNLDGALQCFERSLDASAGMGDPNAEASALNNIGAVYERKGQYSEAEDYYDQSLALRQQVGSPDEVVDALANIAGVMYWQKRWDEALSTFHRVLDMHNVLGSRPGQARTFLNIGAVYENMNSDHEALQAYQQSLAIYSNLGDESGQSQALNNLGIVYLDQGDTERALVHFKRSLALKEKLGDRPGQASTLNNIALLYEKTGSASLALDHYEQSYKLLTALDDSRADLVQENIEKLQHQMERRLK